MKTLLTGMLCAAALAASSAVVHARDAQRHARTSVEMAVSLSSGTTSYPLPCPNQPFNVTLANIGPDRVLGYLASGGSSGFVVSPGESQDVPVYGYPYEQVEKVTTYLQAYITPEGEYIRITGECSTEVAFHQCPGAEPMAKAIIVKDPSTNRYHCRMKSYSRVRRR